MVEPTNAPRCIPCNMFHTNDRLSDLIKMAVADGDMSRLEAQNVAKAAIEMGVSIDDVAAMVEQEIRNQHSKCSPEFLNSVQASMAALTASWHLAAADGSKTTPLGELVDTALADGKLYAVEAQLLIENAKKIGCSYEELRAAVKERIETLVSGKPDPSLRGIRPETVLENLDAAHAIMSAIDRTGGVTPPQSNQLQGIEPQLRPGVQLRKNR